MNRRSSIPPYLPYLFSQAHTHAHTRVRAHARAHNHIIFSMEGMEVWKNQWQQGSQGSIPLPHLKEVWNLNEETKTVTAADVRAAFPQCVAVADAFRAAFGTDTRLTYAEESGQRIGIKGGEPSDITVTAAQMIIEVPEEPKKQPKKEKVRYG